MVQLNVQSRRTFELDCCPYCFGIWLDPGEEVVLQELYTSYRKLGGQVTDYELDEHVVLAKFIEGHEKVMKRYQIMEWIAGFLSQRIRPFRRPRFKDWDK